MLEYGVVLFGFPRIKHGFQQQLKIPNFQFEFEEKGSGHFKLHFKFQFSEVTKHNSKIFFEKDI